MDLGPQGGRQELGPSGRLREREGLPDQLRQDALWRPSAGGRALARRRHHHCRHSGLFVRPLDGLGRPIREPHHKVVVVVVDQGVHLELDPCVRVRQHLSRRVTVRTVWRWDVRTLNAEEGGDACV